MARIRALVGQLILVHPIYLQPSLMICSGPESNSFMHHAHSASLGSMLLVIINAPVESAC
jgi:hypothetical protein